LNVENKSILFSNGITNSDFQTNLAILFSSRIAIICTNVPIPIVNKKLAHLGAATFFAAQHRFPAIRFCRSKAAASLLSGLGGAG
jgi:hypothetical protein